MVERLLSKLRAVLNDIGHSSKLPGLNGPMALQRACCSLLMEVARLTPASAARKQAVIAHGMREQFAITDEVLLQMIAQTRPPTSYYEPVSVINKGWGAREKAKFVERLWCVAMADGEIDAYEDQLVRKLADLLYVGHTDFILAKHRVMMQGATR
jgi:uncharacterized tellurite resistance protein B-like protein